MESNRLEEVVGDTIPNTPVQAVHAVMIVEKEGKFLLRQKQCGDGFRWAFPDGEVNSDLYSPADAAADYTYTYTEVFILRTLAGPHMGFPEESYFAFFYYAELYSMEDIEDDSPKAWQWFDVADLPSDMWEPHRAMLNTHGHWWNQYKGVN